MMQPNVHKPQRFISWLLICAMFINAIVPMNIALAKDDYRSITDAEGTEIIEDESWEAQYPRGTFAFAEAQVSLSEGGNTGELTIYRLGGGLGEAVVTVQLTPPSDDENRYYAASRADYRIVQPVEGIRLGEGEYGNTEIDLVFAENEYEKSITFEPVDDSEHESTEFLLATIIDVQGAAFTETANRATLVINDNEEVIPSTASFKEVSVLGDRNAQNAYLTVQRSEGLQYVFSVDYLTGDNNALAGQDYAPSQGTLVFAPGETEQVIAIPLVQDFTYSATTELSFFVGLVRPLTGIVDEYASIAGVHLVNSFGEQEASSGVVDADGSDDFLSGDLMASSAQQDTPAPNYVTPNLVTLLAMSQASRVTVSVNPQGLLSNASDDTDITGVATVPVLLDSPLHTSGMAPSGNMGSGTPATVQLFANPLPPIVGGTGQSVPPVVVSKPTIQDAAVTKWGDYAIVANATNSYNDESTERNPWLESMSFTTKFYDGKATITRTSQEATTYYYKLVGERASSSDPSGIVIATKPIERLYEYYNQLNVQGQFNLSSSSNRGYIGLGNPADLNTDAKVESKQFYTLLTNRDSNNAWKEGKFDIQKTVALKDIISASSVTASNKLANTYPVLGVYDYASGSNKSFIVNLVTFALRRASIKNLALEYSSADGFINNSKLAPTLSLVSGGIKGSDPYVGSVINISPHTNANGYPIKSVELHHSTTQNGTFSRINTATKNGNNFQLALHSDAASDTDRYNQLSCQTTDRGDYYKIVVVYESRKNMSISLMSALERSANSINTIGALRSALSGMQINGQNVSGSIMDSSNQLTWTAVDALTINFGLPEDYRLVYSSGKSGSIYKGNETINLVANTAGSVSFQVTHKDLLSVPQTVGVKSIDSIELYDSLKSIMGENGATAPLAIFMPGSYSEELFAPQKIGSDFEQRYVAIRYTKQPYVLEYDSSLLPLQETSKYEQKILFENVNNDPVYVEGVQTLAPELLRPRQIQLPPNNSAIEIMGAGAVAGVVYIPLGGDVSGTETYTSAASSWNPKWEGNLAPASESGVSGTSAQMKHESLGIHTVASDNTALRNYLGSFLPFDTQTLQIFACDENGVVTKMDSTFATGLRASRKFIPVSFSDANVVDKVTQEAVPDDDSNSLQRSAQPQIGMPDLNFSLDIFGLSYSDNEILITIGIPVFSKSSGSPDAANDTSNGSSGYFASKFSNYTEGLEKLKEFMQMMKQGSSMMDMAPKADVSASFQVGLSVNMLLTYSTLSGRWTMDSVMFLVAVGGSVSVSQKLPPPVSFIYVYVVFGADVTISTGLGIHESLGQDGKVKRTVYFKGVMLEPKLYAEIGAGVGVDGVLALEVYFKMNIGMKATIGGYNEVTQQNDQHSFDNFSLRGAVGFRVELLIFTYEMDVVGFLIEYDKDGHDNIVDKKWKFSKVLFEQSSNLVPFAMGVGGSGAEAPLILDSTADASDPNVIGSKLYLRGNQSSTQQLGSLGTISGQPIQDEMLMQAFGSTPVQGNEFSFGNYNTSSAAYELGNDLGSLRDVQLVEAAGKVFVFYTIDGEGRDAYNKPMIVFSELQMPVDNAFSLVNPYGASDPAAYAVVHQGDETGDGAFSVAADDSTIHLAWVSQKTPLTADDLSGFPIDNQLKIIAENTAVYYSTFDTGTAIPFKAPLPISSEDSAQHEYLPQVAVRNGKVVVSFVQSTPYSEQDISNYIASQKDARGYGGLDASAKQSIDEELRLKSLMMRIIGTMPEIVAGGVDSVGNYHSEKHSATLLDQATYAEDATLNIAKLYMLDNLGGFVIAYILEYPSVDGNDSVIVKNLNLLKWNWDGASLSSTPPKVLHTLLDYDGDKASSKDGVYTSGGDTELFVDPFFAMTDFGQAKLSGSMVENYFVYNMNGNHYLLNEAELAKLFAADQAVASQALFTLDSSVPQDGISCLRLIARPDGMLTALAVMGVADTSNNALFLYEFDSSASQWGEGRPLAMRGLDIYDQLRNGEISEDEARTLYDADDAQFTFGNPQALYTSASNLVIVTDTSMVELAPITVELPGGESFADKMPKMVKAQDADTYIMATPTKQIFALKYSGSEEGLGGFRLYLDDEVLLPGKTITPTIAFTNLGSTSYEASIADPLVVRLVADTAAYPYSSNELARWEITTPIPSSGVVVLNAEGAISVQLPDWTKLNGVLFFDCRRESEATTTANSSINSALGSRMIYSLAEPIILSVWHQLGEMRPNGVDMDLKLSIWNAGTQHADSVSLYAYYVVDGVMFRATDLFNGGSIDIGDLGGNVAKDFTFLNNDYDLQELASNKEFVLNTANDFTIPYGYFQDNKLELVFELATSSATISSLHNKPLGSARVSTEYSGNVDVFDDPWNMVTGEPAAFTIGVSSLAGARLSLREVPLVGGERLLASMQVNAEQTNVTLSAAKAGQTVLRMLIDGTTYYRDVIINVEQGIGSVDPLDTEKPVITITSPSPLPTMDAKQETALTVEYYVTDNAKLNTVTAAGSAQEIENPLLYQGSFVIDSNGIFTIKAVDMAGNDAYENIYIDGYNYQDENYLVKGFGIKDVSWNNISDINQVPYTNHDVALRFTAEAEKGLQSVRVIAYRNNDWTSPYAVYEADIPATPLTHRHVPIVPLTDNGTYFITAVDKEGNAVENRFEITTIDRENPLLQVMLADETLSFGLTDNLMLGTLSISGMAASSVQVDVNGQTNVEDTLSLTNAPYGTIYLRATDKAGNIASAMVEYSDPDAISRPLLRDPAPVFTLTVGQEIRFDADAIAVNSHPNDALSIVDIVGMPNGSLVDTGFDDVSKVVTLKGKSPGDTSMIVTVANESGQHVDITVQIRVQSSGGYVQPSPSNYTTPTNTNRKTIKVAGVDIGLTEEKNGQKAVIAISGVQMQQLLKATDNPLVFDISSVSNAVEVAFGRSSLRTLAEAGKSITITTKQGSITLDAEALLSVVNQCGTQISFLVEPVTFSSLPNDMDGAQRTAIQALLDQGIPVFSVSIFSSENTISTFEGSITVELPYSGSVSNLLTVWYIDPTGTLVPYECTADTDSKSLQFALPGHLSYYAIGMQKPEIEDETETKPPIEDTPDVLAAIVLTIDSIVVMQGDVQLASPPVAPQIIGDRAMLPFRYLIQTLLGGTVHWDEVTRSVTAEVNEHTFFMTIGELEMIIDGEIVRFDQEPVIVGDYTLVPLRVFEAAVETIMWQEITRTVEISP